MQVTVGHSKGETVLPLPAAGSQDTGASDKDHVRFLEAALVTWSQQIKEVLKSDPSSGLLVSHLCDCESGCQCSRAACKFAGPGWIRLMKWSQQTKEVLKSDPSSGLLVRAPLA